MVATAAVPSCFQNRRSGASLHILLLVMATLTTAAYSPHPTSKKDQNPLILPLTILLPHPCMVNNVPMPPLLTVLVAAARPSCSHHANVEYVKEYCTQGKIASDDKYQKNFKKRQLDKVPRSKFSEKDEGGGAHKTRIERYQYSEATTNLVLVLATKAANLETLLSIALALMVPSNAIKPKSPTTSQPNSKSGWEMVRYAHHVEGG